MKKVYLVILILVGMHGQIAYAWSPKTHVYTVEEVIRDIEGDCSVTIASREYALDPVVCHSILENRGSYRLGAIGPDTFPDPLVGQTTAHPGVEGGWQTGDWLHYMLREAKSGSELAFAHGYAAHAAGDVFAHTYVNSYAGDLFSLTDGESEVELRHFTLEKYIDKFTPPINQSGLTSPNTWLADRLIFNTSVRNQYIKSGTGLHLAAIDYANSAVSELEKGTDTIIGELTEVCLLYTSPSPRDATLSRMPSSA